MERGIVADEVVEQDMVGPEADALDTARASICTVTTLRAPLHETLMFVNYHLNIGVDHMYLFFDDPADPAANALAERERVTCVPCDAEYWRDQTLPSTTITERQWINAGVALAWARQAGADWIIHIDSDELVYTEQSLTGLLSACPPDLAVLKFATLEAVPDRYEYNSVFAEISLFKVHPGVVGRKLRVDRDERSRLGSERRSFRRRLLAARLLGCTSISEGTYLRGHIEGKSAVRTNVDLEGLACHEPVLGPGDRVRASVAQSAWLLHFECRGFDSWQRKWLHLQKIRHRLRAQRQRLLDRFVAVYQSDDRSRLSAFYRRVYFLSRYERFILNKLGLLRELRIEATSFE